MKSTMMIVGLCLSMFYFAGCGQNEATENSSEQNQSTEPTQEDMVARGEYLTTIGGCSDCHTPKTFGPEGMGFDSTKLLSGHPQGSPLPEVDPRALQPGYWVLFSPDLTASVGPWGISFARNLTPHETGIKGWTEEVFIKPLRIGKHMGVEKGRPIMPPMPWFNLARAKTEDLKAIYAFLMSLPPIDNAVPDPNGPDQLMSEG
jgi:hypothetical protein